MIQDQITANVPPVVTILLALIAIILPLATTIIGYLQWKATKATTDAKDVILTQSMVIDQMAKNVDGNLTEVKERLAKVKGIADALAAEIIRLQEKGTTTPYGSPSEENPVTLSAGLPITKGSSSNPKDVK